MAKPAKPAKAPKDMSVTELCNRLDEASRRVSEASVRGSERSYTRAWADYAKYRLALLAKNASHLL